MKAMRLVAAFGVLLVMGSIFAGTASAQYFAGADIAFDSKYIWRGQRLTDEPVVQPSLTIGYGGFGFNAWGNLELTDINGLEGQMTEIDYTFSYDHSFDAVSVGGGVIFYTFPWAAVTTTELYGSVAFDSVPAAPSVTLYVDVDETTAGDGSAGVYLLLAAGHSFETGADVVPSIDIGGSVAFANSGFNNFYYDPSVSGGGHDVSVSVSVPIVANDNWSFSPFVSYNGLIHNPRSWQYTNPNPGVDNTDANTVHGGVAVSLSF